MIPIRGVLQAPLHAPAELVAPADISHGAGEPPFRGLLVVPGRFLPVLLHAASDLIAPAQGTQAPGRIQLRAPPVPVHGLLQVLFHALAVVVAPGQIAHGPGASLVRGQPVEPHGLLPALVHAFPFLVAQPQGAGAVPVALLAALAVQLHRPLGVAALPLEVPGHIKYRVQIAALRGFGVVVDRFFHVPAHVAPLIAQPQVEAGGHVIQLRAPLPQLHGAGRVRLAGLPPDHHLARLTGGGTVVHLQGLQVQLQGLFRVLLHA